MQRYAGLSRRYLAFPLTFKLAAYSRRRLIWANVLPMIMVTTVLVVLVLTFANDPSPDFGFWERLENVARSLLEFGIPLTVAVLFAGGLQKWSRAEGSWMFAIGIGLAAVAFAMGAVGVLIIAAVEPQDFSAWGLHSWGPMAWHLAFLSVPYFFVAHRSSLARGSPRSLAREGRPRPRERRA